MDRIKTNALGLVGLLGFCASSVAFLSSLGLKAGIPPPPFESYGTIEEAMIAHVYEDRERMYERCAIYSLGALAISTVLLTVGACKEENYRKEG
mgnify:CR=1 FL=1